MNSRMFIYVSNIEQKETKSVRFLVSLLAPVHRQFVSWRAPHAKLRCVQVPCLVALPPCLFLTTRGSRLFQADRAKLQLRLLGDSADGADRQVIGGVALAKQVPPMERHENHTGRDALA